jgi:prepilin-type N-terminal cleavage/methylation domain-containing protein
MQKRHAFTLIELIFVIVVLGIVASIGAQIVASVYERYLISRGVSKLEDKVELALDQIANRLQYRIKATTIARDGSNQIVPLAQADNTFAILEWIGYDNDSLNGAWDSTLNMNAPGWSGFIDLDPSTGSTLVSPGSHFETARNIIETLSNGSVDLNGSICNTTPAVIFKGNSGSYDICDYGWQASNCGNDHNASFCVKQTNSNTLQILSPTPLSIFEQYHLAWSAYALVPTGSDCSADTPTDCNLTLYYNYQPWSTDTRKYGDGNSSVLLDHITTFRFRQIGSAVHIKLCASDAGFNTYLNDTVSICKERMIP